MNPDQLKTRTHRLAEATWMVFGLVIVAKVYDVSDLVVAPLLFVQAGVFAAWRYYAGRYYQAVLDKVTITVRLKLRGRCAVCGGPARPEPGKSTIFEHEPDCLVGNR